MNLAFKKGLWQSLIICLLLLGGFVSSKATTISFDRIDVVEFVTGGTGTDSVFLGPDFGVLGGIVGIGLDAHENDWNTLLSSSITINSGDISGSATGSLSWNLAGDVVPQGPGRNSVYVHVASVYKNGIMLGSNSQSQIVTYLLGIANPPEYTKTWVGQSSVDLFVGDVISFTFSVSGTGQNAMMQIRNGASGSLGAPTPITMTFTPSGVPAVPEPAFAGLVGLAGLVLLRRRR